MREPTSAWGWADDPLTPRLNLAGRVVSAGGMVDATLAAVCQTARHPPVAAGLARLAWHGRAKQTAHMCGSEHRVELPWLSLV